MTEQLRRASGYGLLEIALGIAIAALLVAGAMMYFVNANQERKVNETLQFVTALHSTVHSIYASQPDYSQVNTAMVANSHMLPHKFKKNPGSANPTLRHPFGSTAQVFPNQAYRASMNSFIIKLFYIPKSACPAVVTKIHGNAVDQWRIGSVAYTNVRMTPELAAQACSSATEERPTTVNLEFMVR